MANDYRDGDATIYAKHQIEGTLILAYREFPRLFTQYVDDTRVALDYGCGSGRSTRYLADMGFQVEGVDINSEMLAEAALCENSKGNPIPYTQIDSGSIAQRASKNDLVFSTLVFLEFPTLEEMEKIVRDIYRVSKFNGTVIILTVSDAFYQHDWVSVKTDLPENKNAQSGDPVYIELKEIGLRLRDYYWTDADYRAVFDKCGFTVAELVQPLAIGDEGVAWLDETACSPYSIYVLKKTVALQSVHALAEKNGCQPFLDRGFFKEIAQSDVMIPKAMLPSAFNGDRREWATIELLMGAGQRWPFHKHLSTETFLHKEGCDLTIHLVYPDGRYRKVYLGEEHNDAVKEFVVEPGTWLAEEVEAKGGYAIVEARTAPGFHPDDGVELTHRYQLPAVALQRMQAKTLEKFNIDLQRMETGGSSEIIASEEYVRSFKA